MSNGGALTHAARLVVASVGEEVEVADGLRHAHAWRKAETDIQILIAL